MKIGKDNILGFTQAVEDYLQNGSESGESMKQRLAPFVAAINQLPDLSAKIVQDGAGEIFIVQVSRLLARNLRKKSLKN